MKVSKFGGSSVSNATQIKKVLNIVNSDPERKIVIVSAPGKRHDNDIKTTDLLIRLYEKVINHLDYHDKKREIIQRYDDIVKELQMDESILRTIDVTLEHYINQLKNEPKRLLDALLSCGEDFNAQLIALYNNSQGIPTKYISPKEAGIFVTDVPQEAQILDSAYSEIKKLRDYDEKLIIPGFFGVSHEGYIVTFPRGGSDITGAIISSGVRATIYENFTDVSGIYKANPNIIKDPELIEEITYREMRELSYAGFSVFHDEALQPLYKDRIPVVIKNTNRPQDKGTFIVHDREINAKNVISGTGIDTISIVMRSKQIQNKETKVLNEIRQKCDVDELSIEHDLAILMIVGEGMNKVIGTANKITHALAESKINLKMINQGASEISMMFGIHVDDAEKAVLSTYEFCYHGVALKNLCNKN
ncbi:TPA: aspartate kinase [Staphylococcus aureus]|nr:aspartate kinase [Staphylococcus aureus]